MKYEQFVATLRQHQRSKIKASDFPGCCTMDEIPQEFISLLPSLIQILDQNLPILCQENQILTIIGMQIGPPMLESNESVMLNRIFFPGQPNQHLCVMVHYLTPTQDELQQGITNWYGSDTLMIDFVTGLVMNDQRYLSLLEGTIPKGICYGQLPEDKLEKVWQQIRVSNNTVTRLYEDEAAY